MELINKLPKEFLDLYRANTEVSNLAKSGSLSYYMLSRFQFLLQKYSSLVMSFTGDIADTKRKKFEGTIQENLKLLSEKLKSTPPVQILLSILKITNIIVHLLEFTAEEAGADADLVAVSRRRTCISLAYGTLFYLTRLAVTYKKYFSDDLVTRSNALWREASPILEIDNPVQLSFPPLSGVIISDAQGFLHDYLIHKFDSGEKQMHSYLKEISELARYTDPTSQKYFTKFATEFSTRAVDISIPLPVKEEEASNVQV
jgi:hypothetical protein